MSGNAEILAAYEHARTVADIAEVIMRDTRRPAFVCGICGEPADTTYGVWRFTRRAAFCADCSRPVSATYADSRGDGAPAGWPKGLPGEITTALRACRVALWHLVHCGKVEHGVAHLVNKVRGRPNGRRARTPRRQTVEPRGQGARHARA